MDINALRTFLVLADTGSFSRTAEQLHLTQPAISKRIASLETQLGTRLFDRIGKQVQLTEAGRALVPGSQRVLAAMDEARRVLSRIDSQVQGRLRIAASHHVGLHRLPAVMKQYIGHYPEVDLDIRFIESEQACSGLLHGDFELAMITLPDQPQADLRYLPLWSDPMRCVVAPTHPLASRASVDVPALLRYPAILPTVGTYTRQLLETSLGVIPPDTILLETSYLETIRAMVEAGLGWSMLPASMCPGLAEVALNRSQPERHLGIVLHRARTLSNPAHAMLTMLGTGSQDDSAT